MFRRTVTSLAFLLALPATQTFAHGGGGGHGSGGHSIGGSHAGHVAARPAAPARPRTSIAPPTHPITLPRVDPNHSPIAARPPINGSRPVNPGNGGNNGNRVPRNPPPAKNPPNQGVDPGGPPNVQPGNPGNGGFHVINPPNQGIDPGGPPSGQPRPHNPEPPHRRPPHDGGDHDRNPVDGGDIGGDISIGVAVDDRPAAAIIAVEDPAPVVVADERPAPASVVAPGVELPPAAEEPVEYKNAAAPSIDLEMVDIRLVDVGSLENNAGPRLRLFCRNKGTTAAPKFHVSVLADVGTKFTKRAQLVTVECPGVDAGDTQAIDVQLPAAALKMTSGNDRWPKPFDLVAAIADSDNRLQETDKDNNVLTIARSEINPLDDE